MILWMIQWRISLPGDEAVQEEVPIPDLRIANSQFNDELDRNE